MIANSARGQLNKESVFSLPLFAPENLVSSDSLDPPVLRQSAHSPRPGWNWCLLADFSPSSRFPRHPVDMCNTDIIGEVSRSGASCR